MYRTNDRPVTNETRQERVKVNESNSKKRQLSQEEPNKKKTVPKHEHDSSGRFILNTTCRQMDTLNKIF